MLAACNSGSLYSHGGEWELNYSWLFKLCSKFSKNIYSIFLFELMASFKLI